MSAYGYVPLASAPALVQAYSIASPATWTFARQMSTSPHDLAYFGGVEEEAFTDDQIAEITALGGAHFASAEAFNAWLHQYA